MTTAIRAKGLVHLGLIYDSSDDLVTSVVPHLRDAVQRDHAVFMIVDRGVAHGVRDALGDIADRITAPPPGTVFQPDAQSYVGRLHAWADPDHRTLVLGQYSAFGVGDCAWALAEDGVNLVLSDRALTMLCACSRSARAGLLATCRHSHPTLLTSGIQNVNPDFAPPADHCRVPDRMWGPCVLRTTFHDPGDLKRIRDQVAQVAQEAGLRGDAAKTAVLAVHEAALLASRPNRHRDTPAHPDDAHHHQTDPDCVLEVRVSARSMFSEVRAPRRAPEVGGPGTVHARSAADPLRHVRWFCHDAARYDEADTRTIRVLTNLLQPAPHRSGPAESM